MGLHKKFYAHKMKNQEMNTEIKGAETEYIETCIKQKWKGFRYINNEFLYMQ